MRKKIIIGLMGLLSTFSVAFPASANLVTNGSFEITSATGSTVMSSGSNVLTGWTVGATGQGGGYTFLTFPGTAATDIGYGFGLWSSSNGGVDTIPNTSPDGGKFIVADGAYSITTLYQTISGLQVGQQYLLSFYQAAGQQQNFDGSTQEQWRVTFGGTLVSSNNITLPNGQVYTTTTDIITGGDTQLSTLMNNPNHGFQPWQQQKMTFTATATSELLGFLALGSPLGQPPFALIDGVSLQHIPEPDSFWLFGLGIGAFALVRRYAQK